MEERWKTIMDIFSKRNITVIGPKDFMLATIKTRIAKSIFQKSASIVANHPLNIMMLSVFVTDIQNEPCYLN